MKVIARQKIRIQGNRNRLRMGAIGILSWALVLGLSPVGRVQASEPGSNRGSTSEVQTGESDPGELDCGAQSDAHHKQASSGSSTGSAAKKDSSKPKAGSGDFHTK